MAAAPTSARTFWYDPDGVKADDERHIPFGSSSVQHGVAVFEGIRGYGTPGGLSLFRADAHLERMLNSARLLGLPHGYDLPKLTAAVHDAAERTGSPGCYVRPGLFTQESKLTIDLDALAFRLGIEVWPMPPAPADPKPVRLTVSPWRRPSPSTFPRGAKAVGTYVFSSVAKTAAVAAGFDDAVQLDPDSGRVAEATTTNIFLVRDGVLATPWLTDNLLPGITRHSVLVLARDLGVPVEEGPVEVGDLRAADEVFLTGTAGELAPVTRLDQWEYPVRRPVFDKLSAAFRAAVTSCSERTWVVS